MVTFEFSFFFEMVTFEFSYKEEIETKNEQSHYGISVICNSAALCVAGKI